MITLNEYCKQISCIDEYLSTKGIKVNVFPNELNLKKTIEFLKNENYKEIELPNNYEMATNILIKRAAESDTPLLFISDSTLRDDDGKKYTFIRFCKNGEISKKNPIFLLRFGENGKVPRNHSDGTEIGFCSISDGKKTFSNIITYEQFLETIQKYFDWRIG